jgi:subtilisin family serine protease
MTGVVARFISLVTGALVLAGILAPAASAADRIVIRRAPGLSAAERADLRADAGVKLAETLPVSGLEVVRPADGDSARALTDLREDPDVVWAERDRRRSLTGDPLEGLEWGLNNIGQSIWGTRGTTDADIDAPEAWALTRGAGATVAVVDTGVDAGHPDLAANLLPGWDFVEGDGDPTDANGHGTHVAGTIAAAANGTGVVGVAPEAHVIPLRVLDASGSGWGSDVAAAFAWAGDHGVRVVNASLGADGITRAERDAIQNHPNTLYVVAAGNDGANVDSTPQYPCAYAQANVLCVGATDANDAKASFSNYGATNVDLFAPGTKVVSTYPLGFSSNLVNTISSSDGFELMQGTSMATPHAAGAAALVAAAHPSFTALQIKAALMTGVDPIPALAGKSVTGGRLNAAAALGVDPPAQAPVSTPAPTPTPAPPAPTPPSTTPAPVPAPPVAVTPSPARLSSVRLRHGTLSFTSSAPTRVSVQLRRHVRGAWRSAGSTSRSVGAGTTHWHVRRTILGLRLHRGSYRLTLSAPGGAVTIAFRVG